MRKVKVGNHLPRTRHFQAKVGRFWFFHPAAIFNFFGKTILQISLDERLPSFLSHEVWVGFTLHAAPRLDAKCPKSINM